jgi:hypothetical protein
MLWSRFFTLTVLSGACVSSDFADGQFLCDPAGNASCPPDMMCAADGTCRRGAAVGGTGECVPRACSDLYPQCGTLEDGCGAMLVCGCEAPLECGATEPGVCGCGPSAERAPGMAVNDVYGDDNAWSNLDRALTDDGLYAVTQLPAGEDSHRLHLLDFGFDLPPEAIIDGIEASVERSRAGDGAVRDLTVIMMRDEAGMLAQASGKNLGKVSGWPVNDAVQTYGGPSEQWGVDTLNPPSPWTPEAINHPNFGLRIRVINDQTMSSTAQIDYVKLRVHYHCP